MELWGVRAGVWNNNPLQTPPADSSTPPGRPAGGSGLSNLSEKRPRATLDRVGSGYKKKIFIFGSFWNHPGLAILARLQGLARGVELWFWLVWDEGGGQRLSAPGSFQNRQTHTSARTPHSSTVLARVLADARLADPPPDCVRSPKPFHTPQP